MKHLGTVTGTGRVLIRDVDIGSAAYRIDVYRPRYLTEAYGEIEGDPSMLDAVSDTDSATLELEGGGSITFFMKSWVMGSRRMVITISGPVPGFR